MLMRFLVIEGIRSGKYTHLWNVTEPFKECSWRCRDVERSGVIVDCTCRNQC